MTARGDALGLATMKRANGIRGWPERSMKIVAVLGPMLFSAAPALAQSSLNWPETIELLAQERTQAGNLASRPRSSSSRLAIATKRLTYRACKSASRAR